MTQLVTQCSACRHFHREDRAHETCAAFPEGIPADILANRLDHRRPIDGDHGVTWQRAPDAPGHPLVD